MSEQFDVILGGLDTEVDVTIADSTGVDPSVLLALRGEKGDKGDPGVPGQDGSDGVDGADGFSPTATVTKSGDTATITITDKDGTTTASISDGSGGASAFVAEFGITTYADVKDAYDDDAIIICTADDSGNTMVLQLVYFDATNEIFFFAEPNGDGVYWTELSNANGWDDGTRYLATTDVATQLRDGLMSALDWQKLDGIASGAEVNVQSDWNQSVNTADDYIKNKPTIPTVNNATLTIQKNGTTVNTFTANASSNVTANITVPTDTGDLTNGAGFITGYTETDPVFSASAASGITSSDISDWNAKSKVSVTRHTTSGTNIADLTIDGTTTKLYAPTGGGGGITDVTVDGTSVVTGTTAAIDLTGKSDVGHTHTKSAITDFPTLSAVATSGSYNDLLNKPTIPTVNNATLTIQKNGTTVNTFTANASSNVTANITVPTVTDTYSGTSSDGMSGKAVKSAIDALDGTVSGTAGSDKTLTAFSQTDGKVSATFGSISITKSQVSDFPTIPTVNDATLTIQKNGTNVETFTANASSNVTANITVPTDTGDLTNGAGFITGGTPIPTADTVAEFDGDAHMNSEDMTSQEVEDFVDALNVTGINAVDYVVEQGVSGIWTYRKWNSGIAECWGAYTTSIAVNTSAVGYGGYRSSNISIPTFPLTFSSAPSITATPNTAQGYWVNNVNSVSTTSGSFYLSSGTSLAAASRTIAFYVVGKWK